MRGAARASNSMKWTMCGRSRVLLQHDSMPPPREARRLERKHHQGACRHVGLDRPARQERQAETGPDQLDDRLGQLHLLNPGRQTRRPDDPLHHGALLGRRIHEHRLVVEITQPHLPLPRERVEWGGDDHEVIVEERPRRKAPIGDRRAHDGQIEAAGEQRTDGLAGRTRRRSSRRRRRASDERPSAGPAASGSRCSTRSRSAEDTRPPPESAARSWRTTSISSRTRRADDSSRSPAGVSTMRFPTRRKRGRSRRDSISRNWWLRADCVRWRTSPARVSDPSSATDRTSRRCRISMSMA